jgi:hypothetical protein
MFFYVMNGSDAVNKVIGVTEFQIEFTDAELVQVASEFVNDGVVHNADTNGTKYFTTLNGNTVDGNGFVSLGSGATIPLADRPGLFLEPIASTNLIDYSYDMSMWTAVNGPNVNTDQPGLAGITNTASRVEDATPAGTTLVRKAFTVVSGQVYVYSVFVKKQDVDPATVPWLDLGFTTAGVAGYVNFSPARNALSTDMAAWNATVDPSDFGRIDRGDWWQFWVRGTPTATNGVVEIYPAVADRSNPTDFGGSYQNEIVVGHAQCERQDFLTSPIVTNGSSATRAAEIFTNGAFPTPDWRVVLRGQVSSFDFDAIQTLLADSAAVARVIQVADNGQVSVSDGTHTANPAGTVSPFTEFTLDVSEEGTTQRSAKLDAGIPDTSAVANKFSGNLIFGRRSDNALPAVMTIARVDVYDRV